MLTVQFFKHFSFVFFFCQAYWIIKSNPLPPQKKNKKQKNNIDSVLHIWNIDDS